MEVSDYAAMEDHLNTQIGRNRMLRDAARPDSADAQWFQGVIDADIRLLRRLRANLPDLRELDVEIHRARYAAHVAGDDLLHAPVRRLVRGGLLTVAGLGCLVMAVAGWGGLSALAGLVLAVGGGVLAYSTAVRRRRATDDRDDALVRLRDAETRRDTLMHPERDAGRDGTGNGNPSRDGNGTVPLTGVFADAARDGTVSRD